MGGPPGKPECPQRAAARCTPERQCPPGRRHAPGRDGAPHGNRRRADRHQRRHHGGGGALLASLDVLQADLDVLRTIGAQPLSEPMVVSAPEAARRRSAAAVPQLPAAAAPSPRRCPGACRLAPVPPCRHSAPPRSRCVCVQLLDRLVNQAGEVMISRSRLDARRADARRSPTRRAIWSACASSCATSRCRPRRRCSRGWPCPGCGGRVRPAGIRPFYPRAGTHAHDGRVGERRGHGAAQPAAQHGRGGGRPDRPGPPGASCSATCYARAWWSSRALPSACTPWCARHPRKPASRSLDISGGSIEMDRGVLDRMAPAFEHLLRNCAGMA